jgi:hypothetical protein
MLLSVQPVLAQEDPVATTYIDLPETLFYPEGITNDGTGTLWVSGFGSSSLLRVGADDSVETFKSSGEDGLTSPVGLAADLDQNRLWVASFDAESFASKLTVFDLVTGDLLATMDGPEELGPHFFNEVLVAEDGQVFVSDTLQPRIWTAGPELTQPLTILAEDPLLANPDPERAFGLNGLTLSPDGAYLIGSIMDRLSQGGGRLVRIDPDSGDVVGVALSGDLETFGGSDGMFFEPTRGSLVMVNVTPPSFIVTAEMTDDYTSAALTNQPYADTVLDRASSTALRGDRLWVVNSQLDHVFDDGNGAFGTDPDLPFQLVGVDAEAALGR